jgi:hypothetical protein
MTDTLNCVLEFLFEFKGMPLSLPVGLLNDAQMFPLIETINAFAIDIFPVLREVDTKLQLNNRSQRFLEVA